MQKELLLKERALNLINQLRRRIIDPGLCARHRRRGVDFSRQCRLTFPVLMLLLLQKSLKSLQSRLHEWLWQLGQERSTQSLSAGALTHARAKLCASAFVELNQQVLLPTVYGAEHQSLVQQWRGHRLLGVDSTVVRLPNSAAVGKAFGWEQCSNDRGTQERYPFGRLSIIYDLLNELALDARLVGSRVGEEPLAREQFGCLQPEDLLLNDRGYTSYCWVLAIRARGAHFVSRCSRSSFAQAQHLFRIDRAGMSVKATLKVSKAVKAQCRRAGWPLELEVRFVTVRLCTGELEVLVTSLLDERAYPSAEFADLYWCRWGQETCFGRLKARLDLEHCSGLSVEAVEQDFFASVLLSNLESVIIGPAAAELAARTAHRKQPVKINHAVSFHALKSRLIELLASPVPPEQVLEDLTQYFQANPVSIRPRRKVPRREFSASRSYHFIRYVRKIVF
ncbi:MAG TPA: IS4 family transposase [Pyrinomonadaceae bacterium]|nr:IS4 family transposase [Pyrinomonadaceae bacterium]